MKKILYTGCNQKMDPLGAITMKRMAQYAQSIGMGFVVNRNEDPHDIYWTGVELGLELLQGDYDKVVYMDCDQLITNTEVVPVLFLLPGFNAPRDWGADATEPHHFSMCCFSADRSCIPIFERAISMRDEWRDKPFPEQGPMQHIYKTYEELRSLMRIHQSSSVNRVPIEVHESVVKPWKPGCWAAHITMLPIEDRVRLAMKILLEAE